MATSTLNRRIINLPASQAPKVQAVVSDILSTVHPYNPVITASIDGSVLHIDFLLTVAQDTALVALMSGWATRLGVQILDTHVTVAVTAGH